MEDSQSKYREPNSKELLLFPGIKLGRLNIFPIFYIDYIEYNVYLK